MELCDLHTHSLFSDGALSPEELVLLAKESGLSAVALTDHNTLDGLERFLEQGEKLGVETIAGVEISSEYNGVELHILALFLQRKDFAKMQDFLSIHKKRKEENNISLANRLVENGYMIDYQEIRKKATGVINRVHFANALIEKGYIKSVKEGFDTILSEKNGLYIPPKRLTAFEVIEFIKSINALSILAHPLLDLTREELLGFLKKAKPLGLNGVETIYSEYSIEEQEFSKNLANDLCLLQSGGSDFHGENKPHIKIGIGRGQLKIPYQFVTNMKMELEKK
jgi:predicted metal-dependent phosphoesterase TrpH